jgi:hypothetical protein
VRCSFFADVSHPPQNAGYANSWLSPCVYGLFLPRLRAEARRVFCCGGNRNGGTPRVNTDGGRKEPVTTTFIAPLVSARSERKAGGLVSPKQQAARPQQPSQTQQLQHQLAATTTVLTVTVASVSPAGHTRSALSAAQEVPDIPGLIE